MVGKSNGEVGRHVCQNYKLLFGHPYTWSDSAAPALDTYHASSKNSFAQEGASAIDTPWTTPFRSMTSLWQIFA